MFTTISMGDEEYDDQWRIKRGGPWGERPPPPIGS